MVTPSRSLPRGPASALAAACLALLACGGKAVNGGDIGGGGRGGGGSGGIDVEPTVLLGTPLIAQGQSLAGSGKCDKPTTGAQPVRRLSRVEYDAAVRDLFGDDSHPAAGFVPEEKVAGFGSNSKSPVSGLAVEQLLDAAEAVASRVLANVAQVTGCTSDADKACVKTWLSRTARRAFRGTMPSDEEQKLLADYDGAAAEDAKAGLLFGVEAILTSPRFLYTLEVGRGGTGVVALTGPEIAGRLALMFWKSVPDDALLADANAGKLDNADGVMTAARRLLSDAKADAALGDFAAQWLQVESAPTGKDSKTFPAFTPALASAMAEEPRRFFREVVRSDDGKFGTLLTADWTIANRELASLYGGSASGDGFARVGLGSERRGMLTQAGVLATASHPVQASPVLRGKLVREQLLCDPVLPPPKDVNTNINPVMGKPDEQVFAEHANQPRCAACHNLMDEIGKGFARFDAIGAYRSDASVATTGKVVAPVLSQLPDDVSGSFDGAAALADKLAQSQQAQQCYALQTFRWSLARAEVDGDACAVASLWDSFSKSRLSLKDALVAMTGTDAFRFRVTAPAGGSCR